MDKGPKSITTTSLNPTEQAQLPYLQQGWNQAKSLYEDIGGPRYYPGSTLATPVDPNPYLRQGYGNLAATANSVDKTLRPAANEAWFGALKAGDYQNSPAYQRFKTLAEGQDPEQANLRRQGDAAIADATRWATALGGPNLGLSTLGDIAQGKGVGMEALAKTASGAYLDPATNPYIRSVVDAAQRPVTEAYQRSTAPQTDYAFESAGRYGSGAMMGARSQNESNLARGLGELSGSIYNTNYQNERARQDAASGNYSQLQSGAASNYGQLYDTGQRGAADVMSQGYGRSAANIAQDLQSQQYGTSGLQGAYQQGTADKLSALSQYPSILNANYNPANALVQAGQGLTATDNITRQNQQQVIDDQIKRYDAQQNQPFQDLAMYQQAIGQPSHASSISTKPNPTNPLTSALSGIVGGVGLADKLAGSTALSSLFGGSGAAGAGAAAAAAPAAWIICTELMSQRRMPKRWWLAGLPTFEAYPEIGKRGYYVWAIPSVRHLREHPHSLYSRFLCAAFNWRAEDLAARKGVKGARKLWRGRLVTAALVLPCLILGAVSPEQDWRSVYRRA